MAKSDRNFPSIIKAIFTNLIFVIGIILTVIGFIRGTSTAVKLAVFDEYPLNSYEESRCDVGNMPQRYPTMENSPIVAEDFDREKFRSECLESLEKDRKLRLVEDVTGSISFFIAGMALAIAFRRFIFEK